MKKEKSKNEILIYQTEDGQTKVEVVFDGDTVWLTQDKIAELFGKGRSTVTEHINNIIKDGELDEKAISTSVGNADGSLAHRPPQFYNLQMILAVGYRVNSLRGIQFRKWASNILTEYMKKGFAMNDEQLRGLGGGAYWKELLERIRDIRSSEKVFYRQILDIYATSIDYDPKAETTIMFFKQVQNKMHYATHGHTASEIVYARADAELPFMGLTSFKGDKPLESEVVIAKNYLSEGEIKKLNRISSMYLDYAENQAEKHAKMTMKDWVAKLDAFLQNNEEDVLLNAGMVSHKSAVEKAGAEYKKYRAKTSEEFTKVERDFMEQVSRTYRFLEKKDRPKK
ncbi:MAG: virulence RhuM family protein [Candidatus Methanoplasma sp.]|nr:virulence RhuM family protein [Candidatus Methanoplasma sp.]